MRIYDPRVGRFLFVDPLTKSYPHYTPYSFAGNKPIAAIDVDGAEELWSVAKANMDNRAYEAYLRKTDPQHAEQIIRKNNLIGMGAVRGGILLPFDMATGGNITRTLGTVYMAYGVSEVYEYTNRNSNQRNPIIRAQNDRQARGALIDLGIGFGIGKTASVMTRIIGEGGEAIYKYFSSSSIRFSQSSVNGLGEVVKSMEKNGWKGDPIDIVKMEDGIYAAVDNTRLTAAEKVGINVKANAHSFDEVIPEERAKTLLGKDGSIPKTWGEAIQNRIKGQNKQFRTDNPNGTFDVPKEGTGGH